MIWGLSHGQTTMLVIACSFSIVFVANGIENFLSNRHKKNKEKLKETE